MFAKVGKRFSLIPLKFNTLIVTRYCNYNLSLQPLTLTDIWIVQVKPIAPESPRKPLPIPDVTAPLSEDAAADRNKTLK